MQCLTSYFPYNKPSSHAVLIITVILSWNVVMCTVTCLGEKIQLQFFFSRVMFSIGCVLCLCDVSQVVYHANKSEIDVMNLFVIMVSFLAPV